MASGGTKSVATIPNNAPKWVLRAKQDLGKKEWVLNKKGQKVSNPEILNTFHALGHKWVKSSISTPWCAAWIGDVLEEAGYVSTKKLNARSYLEWGEKVDTPKLGDVVIFWRGKKDDGVTGHVAFLIKESGSYIWCLGGNQGDSVSIEKFSKRKVLGYRRPRNVPVKSKTIRAAGGSAATGTAAQAVAEISKAIDKPEPKKLITEVRKEVDTIKTDTNDVASFLPQAAVILTIISVALALLAIYYRYKDYKKTGL